MRTQSPDTAAEAEAVLFEAYRRMGPEGRARRVSELCRAASAIAAAQIRAAHPGIGDRELKVRIAARSLDRDLLRRAYPDIALD